MSFATQTLIMQYLFGFLLASLPALIWGYIFWKKNPEDKKITFISFFAGTLSTLPILLYRDFATASPTFFGFNMPNLDIFVAINNLLSTPSLFNIIIFTIISALTALFLFLIITFFAFIIDLVDGDDNIASFRKKAKSIATEIYTFTIIGLLTGIIAYLFNLTINEAIFTYLLVGALEEFVKHIWVRFVDDGKFSSIADVMLMSILVGLGFAFLENIIYFVDNIWLAPCSTLQIANGECLLNPQTNEYVHNVGVLLMPFIGRALLSVLAHACFSGIFGYFYGYAIFAKTELVELEKSQRHPLFQLFLAKLHLLFHLRKVRLYKEEKIMSGLLAAMTLHMIFNFLLEKGLVLQAGIFIFACFMYISYLFSKYQNHMKLNLFNNP